MKAAMQRAMPRVARRAAAAVVMAVLCAASYGQTRPAAANPSLLDQLPRVSTSRGGYAAALAAAQKRGEAGAADALWIELFYGPPAAKAEAEAALAKAGGNTPEMAFLQFMSAYSHGQDRQMLEAALRLTESAPNDVATELAVRSLSGQLENQGRALLDAVPAIEHTLDGRLSDPVTAYMLGRSLLAAVHAPGVALTPERARTLAGRPEHWRLWGPFGKWQNLDFDTPLPIERGVAASYSDGSETRHPQPYESARGSVQFPLDWEQTGLDYAVTYVHAGAPTRVAMRLYSAASAKVEINGVTVISNDRRSSYRPAATAAMVAVPGGWSRVVVKLGGGDQRDFDLMMRPETAAGAPAAAAWSDAGALPAGAKLAGGATVLKAPVTLGQWSTQRLAEHPDDVVALWVDGIRRMQDEDGENARVALTRASELAPEATLVWLNLSESYGVLEDASQSWAAAQMETTAQKALKADPQALRAYDRLGHVYQSEGKNTQAAEQYAHCAGKGYADCDWSAFHLAVSQRWTPEARRALDHALAESGSDWNSIASGLGFYASIGDAAKVEEWERVLKADPRAAGTLGAYELNQGHASPAAELLATAIGFEPSSAELRREYLEALLLQAHHSAGAAESAAWQTAQTAATKALNDFPYNQRIAGVADDIGLSQNLGQGIADLQRTDYGRNGFRHEADFLTNQKFWQPWYHSAAEILSGAPGKSEYPNASSILVFDQMVNRINPDSTQDQYIHQIYRVLNAAGISELGDQSITAGSDLITVRTIKQNGAMLLPEKVANLSSITMPGLEAGDYIEVEYVQHMPASTVIPNTMNNDEFFVFNSSKQPYHYSDYIVLTPPGYPLLVDQERFPAPPQVTTLADGYTAREWLIQKTRILVTEPHMPPETQLVPKVWVSSNLSWDEMSRYVADHLYEVRKATPEMTEEADKLIAGQSSDVARANAIFNWVAANIQPASGVMLQPARQYFTDGSGNRTSVFMGLLAAAKVPYQLALTRGVTDDSSTKIPSLYQFSYPLIHVAGGAAKQAASGWYDLNGDFARQDYIVPGVRGAQALVAGATGAEAFTRVPEFTSPLDGISVGVAGTVADSGDATLKLTMEFRGPNGQQIRDSLSNQPASSLPQVYQQMALANYPSASATGGEVKNLSDKSQPLVITVDATVPGFVHNDGGTAWDIEHLASPTDLLQRYAPLPFRTHPLVISGGSYEAMDLDIKLPAKFGHVELPPDAHIDNAFGSFSASYTDKQGAIVFNRRLELKPNLIQPNQYKDFRNFGEVVDNQDRLRITGAVSATVAAAR